MSDATKAVFLSYASQDAEAARRIADTLRASGVEVWFDADGGLEHGDEWDAKIRKQVKECVLFIAVISANTQAREEGYFRIEWDMAAERARGIASGVAFILPVVIDGTREPDALVPDRFRMVQWTKLPGGVVSPDVQARFLKLWSHRTGVIKHQAGLPEGEPAHTHAPVAALPRRLAGAKAGLLAAGVAVVVVGGWFFAHHAGSTPAPPAAPPSAAPATGAIKVDEKSVAVLAFANLSEDKGNESFADSVSEELLNVLSKVPGLKVTARTSAFHFKGKDTPIPEIARQLGVAYVVEGSVRRSGDKVRITAQLIKAADGFHVWSDTFTRELKDVFAVQDEIAGLIARNLELTLGLKTGVARPLNVEAYQLYLEAYRAWGLRDPASLNRAEQLLQRALALQPEFPKAFALMANLFAVRANSRESTTLKPGEQALYHDQLAQAQSWAERALAADPELAEAHAAWGNVLDHLGRWQEAAAAYRRSVELDPNFATGHQWYARSLAGDGYFDEALAEMRRAVELDPLAPRILDNYGILLVMAERGGEALQVIDRALAIQPGSVQARAFRASALVSLGRNAEALTTLASIDDVELTTNERARALLAAGRQAEAEALLAEDFPDPFYRGTLLCLLGRPDEAMPLLRPTQAVHRIFLLDMFDYLPGQSPQLRRLLADWGMTEAWQRAGAWREKNLPKKPAVVAAPAADQKSVAVLAFANLSDDKDNEYFSDGISEELLNVLAKVPGLKVTARTSSFHFKGKDTPVPEIARQLGVAYVVEGSVRKQGTKVRITAQLIKAADGFHVWSDNFDRELKDIFAVQDEIAGLIAKNLQVRLELPGAPRKTVDPAAYQLFLLGLSTERAGSEDDWRKSAEYYRQAVKQEPNLAEAWAGLARVDSIMTRNGLILPWSEGVNQTRAAAEQALKIDPDLPEGLAILGEVQIFMDWNWAGAETSLRHAQALAPSNVQGLLVSGRLTRVVGKIPESVGLFQKVIGLDPLRTGGYRGLADSLLCAGRATEAEAAIRQAIAVAPEGDFNRYTLTVALLLQGRPGEALDAARQEKGEAWRLVALALACHALGRPADSETALLELITKYQASSGGQIVEVYAYRGEKDHAFEWLERAYQYRDPAMAEIKLDPLLINLHDDPRWTIWLRKMGLAADQLK